MKQLKLGFARYPEPWGRAMIPYTLIVASASRPHLLRQTLLSLIRSVDQMPVRIVVHDDAAFRNKQDEIWRIVTHVAECAGFVEHMLLKDSPPILHGPSLYRLLQFVQTDYVLYTQDDHEVIRPLPICDALALMDLHALNYIRFNKRDTMPYKETWQGRWYKIVKDFSYASCRKMQYVGEACSCARPHQDLTISDHWHFQTSLWCVAHIKPVIDWFMNDLHEGAWFGEHAEMKINNAMNGNIERFPHGLISLPPMSCTPEQRERDQAIRAEYQRTFIFGSVDEKAYIKHIGGKPEDWALPHARAAYDGRAEA